MKVLFDQNLSPKLVNGLADLLPDSSHVQSVGLDCASDDQVWEHARVNGFAIVTKDEDYNNLSVVRGSAGEGVCLTERWKARFPDAKTWIMWDVALIEALIRSELAAEEQVTTPPECTKQRYLTPFSLRRYVILSGQSVLVGCT